MRPPREQILYDFGIERPDHLAAGAVDGENAAVRARVIEHAVLHQRHRLHAAHAASGEMHPGDLEILHVAAVDLVEAAETVGFVGAVISGPVLAAGSVAWRRHGVS